MIGAALALARVKLVLELRRREVVFAMLLFVAATIVIVPSVPTLVVPSSTGVENSQASMTLPGSNPASLIRTVSPVRRRTFPASSRAIGEPSGFMPPTTAFSAPAVTTSWLSARSTVASSISSPTLTAA